MNLRPASDFTPDDLAAIWRAGYDGYYVPLAFDAEQLMRHVRWSGIDLALSVVGVEGDAPFGFSLAARDGDKAWIGGFGVAPDFRRRGLATALMRAHVARLDAAGIASTRLEVIDINPAAEVYRRAGFAETRTLDVWEGELADGGDSGVRLDAAALTELHARLHRVEPSWRRGAARLANILADQPEAKVIGVERDGWIAAFAVVMNLPDRFGLFDAAAADAEAGLALLDALAAERPEGRIRLVDEDPDSALTQALRIAEFAAPMHQFEMVRHS